MCGGYSGAETMVILPVDLSQYRGTSRFTLGLKSHVCVHTYTYEDYRREIS